jgi:DNA-binding transcriptional ArsR family regulator
VKKHSWPVLAHLHRLAEAGEPHLIEPTAYDAIADRLEGALVSEDSQQLREAAEGLQAALQALVKASSQRVKDAVRGAANAEAELLDAFWVGQTSFAQAFAARALDKRADDRLVRRLTDRRYERYVRALLNSPLSGEDLVAITGERKETVSRKVAALSLLGAIERRRQGNHVVNMLSPAARTYLKHRNIAPWATGKAPPLNANVMSVLETRSLAIPDHMRHSPVLGATG